MCLGGTSRCVWVDVFGWNGSVCLGGIDLCVRVEWVIWLNIMGYCDGRSRNTIL